MALKLELQTKMFANSKELDEESVIRKFLITAKMVKITGDKRNEFFINPIFQDGAYELKLNSP